MPKHQLPPITQIPADPKPPLHSHSLRQGDMQSVPQLDAGSPETDVDVASNLNDPRLIASIPSELLDPNELIIVMIKPSLWFLILNNLRSFAAIIIVYLFSLEMYRRDMAFNIDKTDLTFGFLFLMTAHVVWQFLEWLGHVYILTDKRMIRIQGFFNVHVYECPLNAIVNTNLLLNLKERIFALGTIGFSTSGQSGVDVFWQMVSKPLEVHQLVVQTLNRYGRRQG